MNDLEALNVDVDGLRNLYVTNEVAQAVLDEFASRGKNSTLTTVSRVVQVFQQKGRNISRGNVVTFFKALEELNCGKYISGHSRGSRGSQTRFEWKVGLVSVGQAATGEASRVEENLEIEQEDFEESDNSINHSFVLRPDFAVTLELPADLTNSEAARLSEFVKTLPFGKE